MFAYTLFSPVVVAVMSLVVLILSALRGSALLWCVCVLWLTIVAVVTIDFVRVYGSLSVALNHGNLLYGILIAVAPTLACAIGDLVYRRRV